jgi:RNase P protein component
VIELAITPLHGIVTSRAGGRKPGRNVVHRRSRIVIVGLMTRHTSRAGQVVVIVDVTIRTLARRDQV